MQAGGANTSLDPAGAPVAAPLEAAWDSIRTGLRRDLGARTVLFSGHPTAPAGNVAFRNLALHSPHSATDADPASLPRGPGWSGALLLVAGRLNSARPTSATTHIC